MTEILGNAEFAEVDAYRVTVLVEHVMLCFIALTNVSPYNKVWVGCSFTFTVTIIQR